MLENTKSEIDQLLNGVNNLTSLHRIKGLLKHCITLHEYYLKSQLIIKKASPEEINYFSQAVERKIKTLKNNYLKTINIERK